MDEASYGETGGVQHVSPRMSVSATGRRRGTGAARGGKRGECGTALNVTRHDAVELVTELPEGFLRAEWPAVCVVVPGVPPGCVRPFVRMQAHWDLRDSGRQRKSTAECWLKEKVEEAEVARMESGPEKEEEEEEDGDGGGAGGAGAAARAGAAGGAAGAAGAGAGGGGGGGRIFRAVGWHLMSTWSRWRIMLSIRSTSFKSPCRGRTYASSSPPAPSRSRLRDLQATA